MSGTTPGEEMNAEAAPMEAAPLAYARGMERLVLVVQELSLARDLETVMGIVRRSARELTGADGATFVLRDGDQCHYADEDAISPLWKGGRFPMSACISGWVMLNRTAVEIEDIYADPRIPHEAYRPTFVKSMAMVPIRTMDPIGAIGNYWAAPHKPSPQEIRLLQALADTTAVAMENVRVYSELEARVENRTRELRQRTEQLRSLAVQLAEVEAKERKRLAETLHDRIQQNLVAMRLKLDVMMAKAADAEPARMTEMSEELGAMIRGAIDDLRGLIGELSPAIIEDAGIERALQWLTRHFRDKHGLHTSLHTLLPPGMEKKLRHIRMFIFDSARELLTNAVRHSGAKTAELRLQADGEILRLEALDDSPGQEPQNWLSAAAGKGFGLIEMRERAESLGGQLILEARPEGGARVSLRLPIAPKENDE